MTEAKYKILVVDDEPDLEALVKQRMRKAIRAGEYEFVFAHNGVEALEKLGDDGDIDMVVSDINMPRMDGLTLLEQIPKVDPNIRSVIVSAYGDMKNIRTAMNRGAFDFVTKPIDFEDLRVTIERTLKHLILWREALSSRDRLVALQHELDVASKMQQSILPTEFPKGSGYEIHANMEAAREVGGDFFDVIRLDEHKVGLAIADVSGKGVPAALFMMSSRTSLKGAAIACPEPGEALQEVNRLLLENNDSCMFVTVFYATYNPKDGVLTYANGGHCPPLLIHADGRQELLELTGGMALGVTPDCQYEQRSVNLKAGDTLILYTDGVSEAMNGDGDEFGIERLQKAVRQPSGTKAPRKAKDINKKIFDAVNTWADDTPQSDDITCMTLVRRKAEA